MVPPAPSLRYLLEDPREGKRWLRSKRPGSPGRHAVWARPWCTVLMLLGWGAAPVVRADAAVDLHTLRVALAGVVADVELERTLAVRRLAQHGVGADRVSRFALALPAGARVIDVRVSVGGRPLGDWRVAAGAAEPPGARPDGLRLRDLGAAVGFEIAGALPDERIAINVRFVAPLTCSEGRFQLRFPGAIDPDPVAPEVALTISLPPLAPRAAQAWIGAHTVMPPRERLNRSTLHGRAPTRAAWTLGYALDTNANVAPAGAVAMVAGLPLAGETWLGLCRPMGLPATGFPGDVTLLFDVSRSVGPVGLSLARAAARQLLEAMPTGTRFFAVGFARQAIPIFPFPRLVTREALDALDAALVPARLENGTALAPAIEFAARAGNSFAALRGQEEHGEGSAQGSAVSPAPGPTSWVFVITDGGFSEHETIPAIEAAAGLFGRAARAAVLLLRPEADPPARPAARGLAAVLPRVIGGVVREFSSDALAGSAGRAVIESVVSDLRRGGDLFASSLSAAADNGGTLTLATGTPENVAPGAGWGLSWPGAGPGRRPLGTMAVRAVRDGQSLALPVWRVGRAIPASVRAARAAKEWTAGSLLIARERRGPVSARLEFAAPSEPGPAPMAERGAMDRGVVQNSLALAFLPRARACYLTRKVAGARDLRLAGRVRLALLLERGEVIESRVVQSTLDRPDIDRCVSEAAFAIDPPRPLHSDEQVVALVNLVFQPRRDDAASGARPLDQEIDLLLGPVTFPRDPGELLAPDPATGGRGAFP